MGFQSSVNKILTSTAGFAALTRRTPLLNPNLAKAQEAVKKSQQQLQNVKQKSKEQIQDVKQKSKLQEATSKITNQRLKIKTQRIKELEAQQRLVDRAEKITKQKEGLQDLYLGGQLVAKAGTPEYEKIVSQSDKGGNK